MKKCIIDAIRWIIFLPAAFISGVVASIIGRFIDGERGATPELLNEALSYGLFYIAFWYVAAYIAPKNGNKVASISTSILAVITIISSGIVCVFAESGAQLAIYLVHLITSISAIVIIYKENLFKNAGQK